MPTIGKGVREIRVQTGRAFRLLYIAQFADAIYVLHVFEKKTESTNLTDIRLARSRLALIRHR